MSEQTRAWSRRRLTRRSFVRGAAAAGAATGVVSLAGCAPANTAAPAPAVAPAATSAPAAPAAAATAPASTKKHVGTLSAPSSGGAPNLDAQQTNAAAAHTTGPGVAYSKLMQFKVTNPVKPGERVPIGDLAESWTQPDDATYLFK